MRPTSCSRARRTGRPVAPYVRGLGDAAPHTGQAPSVGLVLDGVEIDGALAQMIDPWDLAGMAVSYGPSGLDRGREADAGEIDFTSVAPTRAWGLDAQYALEQGFHASDTRVRLDAPVGDDAGLQLTLSHRQRGGYDSNVYTGDPLYGREETTFGRARFDWSVTPQLEADLSVAAGHLDGQGAPFSQDEGLGDYQTAADQPNGESLTAQVYSLTLKDRSALGEVSSITAYVHESQNTAQDLDGGCAPSDLGGLELSDRGESGRGRAGRLGRPDLFAGDAGTAARPRLRRLRPAAGGRLLHPRRDRPRPADAHGGQRRRAGPRRRPVRLGAGDELGRLRWNGRPSDHAADPGGDGALRRRARGLRPRRRAGGVGGAGRSGVRRGARTRTACSAGWRRTTS